MFMGNIYSCNDMFKFNINKINIVSTYMVESTSSFQHARLGHLNYRYLKYICMHDYILYQHNGNDKYKVCIQAKMTKKPFSKVKRNFFY